MKKYLRSFVDQLAFLIILSAIAFLSLFFGAYQGFASTDISGDIVQNSHWAKEGSPYLLHGNIDLLDGISLTIDPGVILKFDESSRLNVHGNMIAQGAIDQKIYFTSLKDDEWGGDSNNDQASTHPSHSDNWAIIIYGKSTPSFSNISLRFSKAGINLISSTFGLNNSSISQSDTGIYAEGSVFNGNNIHVFDLYRNALLAFKGSQIMISSSTIENIHDVSAIGMYESDATITKSFFDGIDRRTIGLETYGNSESGSFPHVSVDDTVFQNFREAIDDYGGNVLIQNSSIMNNEYGIQDYFTSVSSTSPVMISNSIITGNSTAGVYNYSSSFVSASNNWWGNAIGPSFLGTDLTNGGDKIWGNITYTPWLLSPPVKTPSPSPTVIQTPDKNCCSNVIFIPGIEASDLSVKNNGKEDQLWVPAIGAGIKDLYLDPNGKSIKQNIYTKNVISTTYGKDIYRSFINSLNDLVNQKTIMSWESFPYDWRGDVKNISTGNIAVANGKSYKMSEELEKEASTSLTKKVTIITHSNGGLVARMLMDELKKSGKSGLVDKIIMIAAPILGTPEALARTLHGDDQSLAGGLILSQKSARTLSINMPGAYNLLPSKVYFSNVQDPIISFDPSVDKINTWRKMFGKAISSFSMLSDFLSGKDKRIQPKDDDTANPVVLNSLLFNQAINNHALIDTWSPPSGIDLYKLAGWGLSTLSGIKYTTKQNCIISIFCKDAYTLDHEPVFTDDGDKIVQSVSTQPFPDPKNYYFNLHDYNKDKKTEHDHANILETEPVQNFVKNIITNKNDQSSYITNTKPAGSHTLQISVHSPVSLDLYDQAGNHTGSTNAGSGNSDIKIIEENIPNSSYREFGEGKYITLDYGNNYSLNLKGLDIGTFTLDISEQMNNQEVASSTFKDIPVSSGGVITSTISTSSNITLKIDADGDGVVDETIDPAHSDQTIQRLFRLRLLSKIFKRSYFKSNTLLMEVIMLAIKNLETTKGISNEKIITALGTIEQMMNDKKGNDAEKQKLFDMIERIRSQLKNE